MGLVRGLSSRANLFKVSFSLEGYTLKRLAPFCLRHTHSVSLTYSLPLFLPPLSLFFFLSLSFSLSAHKKWRGMCWRVFTTLCLPVYEALSY